MHYITGRPPGGKWGKTKGRIKEIINEITRNGIIRVTHTYREPFDS
jgi:hypothetical protein